MGIFVLHGVDISVSLESDDDGEHSSLFFTPLCHTNSRCTPCCFATATCSTDYQIKHVDMLGQGKVCGYFSCLTLQSGYINQLEPDRARYEPRDGQQVMYTIYSQSVQVSLSVIARRTILI